MRRKMVVVTDLGCFKAYSIDDNEFNSRPRLELVEQFDTIAGNAKLVDQTTDLAGRFPRGLGPANIPGDMSAGERHNIELELRKRLIKQLGERLNQLMRPEDVEVCYLAAAREINNFLLDELDPAVRAKIRKNLPLDLTKSDKNGLLKHFDLA